MGGEQVVGIADFGYRHIARPALFRLGRGDAEHAHHRTLQAMARIQRHPLLLRSLARLFAANQAPQELFGLTFPNPVGLAAGADKDGVALRAWPALGFGFVEAGTVTAHAQPGNPAPRVFRLKQSNGVINRMGFPNAGAAALALACAATVIDRPLPVPLGISLGKSKVTPVENATDDYLTSLRLVEPYADYVAVNVSSPNTPGLRGLQDKRALDELLAALIREATALALARPDRLGDDHDIDPHRRHRAASAAGLRKSRGGTPVPILVKIAPDLDEHAISDVLEVCETRSAAGIIATNTTVGRAGIAPADRGLALEAGGLSGAPLAARALEVVRFVGRHTRLPVIGVGGIATADDATKMFDAGAALVQIYTGMLYRGPGLNRSITRAAELSAAGR